MLGVFVLLSIFVMTHVISALTAFRMIALIPHHLPRLIGFAAQNRVDMDQFSRDAALVGVAGTLNKLKDGMQPRATLANAAQTGAQPQIGQTRYLTGPRTGSKDSQNPNKSAGMNDTTLRASTDIGQPPAPEQET
jgi:hypothetical protein